MTFIFPRGLRGIIPWLHFTFIGVLGNGNSHSRLTFFRLARFSDGGGWRGPALPLPRPLDFLEPFLAVRKTFPSSDIRTRRVRDRGRYWRREQSEGCSTLHVRLLEFRQFSSKKSSSFKRSKEESQSLILIYRRQGFSQKAMERHKSILLCASLHEKLQHATKSNLRWCITALAPSGIPG